MSDNTVELESLLVGPYLWSTSKYWKFYKDVSDLFNKENTSLNFDKEIKQVFGTSNFVEMMGVKYWDIFNLAAYEVKKNIKDKDTLAGANEKKYVKIYIKDKDTPAEVDEKKISLPLLLKVIRDKCEHIKEYDDTVKKALNNLTINGRRFKFFDEDKDGKYVLNDHQYIAFWNFVFPKLVPILWLKFHKELKKYHDDKINISYLQETKLDLAKYVEGLGIALDGDRDNGNVFRRFKGQGECSLEFRGFHKLNKVLRGNEVVTMAVNPKGKVLMSVSFIHSSSADQVMEYIGNAPEAEKLILIFAANITDVEVWKNCKSVDCRVVIFCDPDRLTTEKSEKAKANFKSENSLTFELSDSPVKVCDLSPDKQILVFVHGRVVVHGREMKIQDIFSNGSSMSKVLSGNLLNKLLKRENPVLFGNYVYPEHKGVYIERKLFLSQNKNEEKLQHIYVAVNCRQGWLSQLGRTQVFPNIQHLVNEIDSVKSDCEFILLKEHKEISEEIIKKCDAAFRSRAVRFLDYTRPCNDLENSRIARRPRSNKESRRQLSETEFLTKIGSQKNKTVFFRAASGMGKSKLLTSLGKGLGNSLVIFSAFREFVDILQKTMDTKQCTKTHIKRVIFEVLKCKDKCEKNIVDHWLEQKGSEMTKVELQLDALDEVPIEHLKLALKALKIIENDFHSVRLWITSSRPFPSEMEEIKFVEWNISPFTKNDKRTFFMESWTAKGTNKHWSEVEKACSYLSDMKLTRYPLFCSMIAELYEDNFTDYCEGNLGQPLFQYFLYESLSKKKFALMIKNKIGKELGNNDNDFTFLEETYMQVHIYFALIHLFPQMSNQFTKPSAMKTLTEENICKMRIMTSIQPPAFVHLSYANFFVAQFMIGGIKTGELHNLCSEDTFNSFLLYGPPDESSYYTLARLWEFVSNNYFSKISDRSSLKWLESDNKELAKYLTNNLCGKMNKLFVDEVAEMWQGRGVFFDCIEDLQRLHIDKSRDLPCMTQFIQSQSKEFMKLVHVHEKNAEEIERKNNRGQNFLTTIKSAVIRLLKKFLVMDLNADVYETLDFGASNNFAHINSKSNGGLTPLEEAVQNVNRCLRKDTLELLRDLGANFNELDKDGGDTILKLFLLKKCKDVQLIKLLAEHGSGIGFQKRKGLCPPCSAEKERKAKKRFFFRNNLD